MMAEHMAKVTEASNRRLSSHKHRQAPTVTSPAFDPGSYAASEFIEPVLGIKYLDPLTFAPSAVPEPSKAQISAYMAKLGAKGGRIGGKRRLETLTPARRRAIAKRAAESRWRHKSDDTKGG
jgi:hypothetical protein